LTEQGAVLVAGVVPADMFLRIVDRRSLWTLFTGSPDGTRLVGPGVVCPACQGRWPIGAHFCVDSRYNKTIDAYARGSIMAT